MENPYKLGDRVGLWELMRLPKGQTTYKSKVICLCHGCDTTHTVWLRYLIEGKSKGCHSCRASENMAALNQSGKLRQTQYACECGSKAYILSSTITTTGRVRYVGCRTCNKRWYVNEDGSISSVKKKFICDCGSSAKNVATFNTPSGKETYLRCSSCDNRWYEDKDGNKRIAKRLKRSGKA